MTKEELISVQDSYDAVQGMIERYATEVVLLKRQKFYRAIVISSWICILYFERIDGVDEPGQTDVMTDSFIEWSNNHAYYKAR